MIKNKAIDIKKIFKNIKNKLKTILDFQTVFCFIKHHRIVFKIVLKNYFFKTILKNSDQIRPKSLYMQCTLPIYK